MSPPSHPPESLISALLSTTESSIVPLTRKQVSSGSKLFGAAILSKADLSPVTVATNNERESPLLHGEINCIQTFFASPKEGRPATKDCIFFATHEPCSLCLSGITWSGFNEFYYLFYVRGESRFICDSLLPRARASDTPETLEARPLYNRTNKFFKARSVADIVADLTDAADRTKWQGEIDRVKAMYNELSETYQKGRARNGNVECVSMR